MNINGFNRNNAGVQAFQLNRDPLRQHRQEQGNSSLIDNLPGGKKLASTAAKSGAGISGASMQAMIAADVSLEQVNVQGSVKTQLEGRAGVLGSEIKLDAARGDDVEKKKEELSDIEGKTQDITASQLGSLSDINKNMEDAAKEDLEAARAEDRAEKIDGADKVDEAVRKDKAAEAEAQTDVPVADKGESENGLPEGVGIRGKEGVGNHVDVKL